MRRVLVPMAGYAAAVVASRYTRPPHDARPVSDSYRIAAAQAYLDALVSHRPSGLRLHPRALRRENGVYTAFSGPQMAWELRWGPQFRLVRAIENLTMTVDGSVVTADYEIDVRYAAARPWLRARVHETFGFDRDRPDLIRRVVATVTAARTS